MEHRRKSVSNRGLTLIELLVTMTILFILASVALPLSRMSDLRSREIELRQDLREMREAIDRFKRDWDLGRISHLESNVANAEGAPAGDVKGGIRKYLRRIPEDPIAHSKEWGLRCYSDEPDSMSWCGDDVYDVYSEGDGKGLDGTPYEEW